MLLSIRTLAQDPQASSKGLISKGFWKCLDSFTKKSYFGQPESHLDIINVASKALLKG